MPAPDFPTIYQIEEAVEDAAKSILETAGLDVFTTRSEEDITTPRCAIQFSLGNETGRHYIDSAGVVRPAQWRGVFRVQVVTNRTTEGNNSTTNHQTYKGIVRNEIAQWNTKFTETLLPYHVVADIEHSGSTPSIRTEDDQDVTEISLTMTVSVRATAWPT
jgi:hypothetical protein